MYALWLQSKQFFVAQVGMGGLGRQETMLEVSVTDAPSRNAPVREKRGVRPLITPVLDSYPSATTSPTGQHEESDHTTRAWIEFEREEDSCEPTHGISENCTEGTS